ncbi:hypothetical protein D3C74_395600 [compost metagenome]
MIQLFPHAGEQISQGSGSKTRLDDGLLIGIRQLNHGIDPVHYGRGHVPDDAYGVDAVIEFGQQLEHFRGGARTSNRNHGIVVTRSDTRFRCGEGISHTVACCFSRRGIGFSHEP